MHKCTLRSLLSASTLIVLLFSLFSHARTSFAQAATPQQGAAGFLSQEQRDWLDAHPLIRIGTMANLAGN